MNGKQGISGCRTVQKSGADDNKQCNRAGIMDHGGQTSGILVRDIPLLMQLHHRSCSGREAGGDSEHKRPAACSGKPEQAFHQRLQQDADAMHEP